MTTNTNATEVYVRGISRPLGSEPRGQIIGRDGATVTVRFNDGAVGVYLAANVGRPPTGNPRDVLSMIARVL